MYLTSHSSNEEGSTGSGSDGAFVLRAGGSDLPDDFTATHFADHAAAFSDDLDSAGKNQAKGSLRRFSGFVYGGPGCKFLCSP